MAYTTPTLVAGIIPTDPTVDLTPFIDTADQMVTDLCTIYKKPYTTTKLELIERWLSAHFYALYDQQFTMAKAGTVMVGFQNKIDYDLKLTHWGQTAMSLDTGGNLARWNNQIKNGLVQAAISWLGTKRRFNPFYFPYCDALPLIDV